MLNKNKLKKKKPKNKIHSKKLNRRSLAKSLGGAAVLSAANVQVEAEEIIACSAETSTGEALIPPVGATEHSTACAYCVVGCGYKAYTWPKGLQPGSTETKNNALEQKFPAGVNQKWVSPQMYNEVLLNGIPHHIVVIPDVDTNVVNKGGDHGLGASLAKKLYSPNKMSDRFKQPKIRVGENYLPISWDDALELVAQMSRYIIDGPDRLAWGMKTYSYQFFENTYAITKLCFDAIKTPCWAPHDKPREASDAPGLGDAGINAFSAAYKDWREAEVLFVSGVSLYDAHPVLFNQWASKSKTTKRLIVVNPRRDPTADYAIKNGGLFLQIEPGTDTLLHNSIAWVILTSGWEDSEFIERRCASDAELQATVKGKWRRQRFGVDFYSYREFILNESLHRPENAAEITGISAEKIWQAAEMLARPMALGQRFKASIMIEKGNYWTHNYTNTASVVSLGLLLGAGNRPGRVISRAGGHQRGMLKAKAYPHDLSPHHIDGRPVGVNLDQLVFEGRLRMAWVVGNTWAGGGTAAAGSLYKIIKRQTIDTGDKLRLEQVFPDGLENKVDIKAVLENWQAKCESGGMVLVAQDLYPQAMTQIADIILPAAGWGESDFNRMQGERRLRHYPKLADAPGEAKPDWWIVAQVAQRMGYSGFNWSDGNAVFEEGAAASKGKVNDYSELVSMAREQNRPANDLLKELGTEGIQCPVRRKGDELFGTDRLHKDKFATPTGKALFVKGAWEDALERQNQAKPRSGELWVLNRRHSGTWSAMVEDFRIPYRLSLYPDNAVEIHPEDAQTLDLLDGDSIQIQTTDLLDSSWHTSYLSDGSFEGVVKISTLVKKGTCMSYFNYGGDPSKAANNVVQNIEDPINKLYAFKLGRGRIVKL